MKEEERLHYPCSENKGANLSVAAKLVCAFVFACADCWFFSCGVSVKTTANFAYADCWFSHAVFQLKDYKFVVFFVGSDTPGTQYITPAEMTGQVNNAADSYHDILIHEETQY